MHEKLSQIETLLDSVCAGPLPVADRLELRRLADALCHASKVTDEPPTNTGRVDGRLRHEGFKANLKRRTDARDGLTSKRLMDLPDDARSHLRAARRYFAPLQRQAPWQMPRGCKMALVAGAGI